MSTCDRFDDLISLVVAAVASLESNFIRRTVGGFEPWLQVCSQVFHHVLLEGLACSSDLRG